MLKKIKSFEGLVAHYFLNHWLCFVILVLSHGICKDYGLLVPTTINWGSRLPVLSCVTAICILGFHKKRHGQQIKAGDSFPLLPSLETTPGVLHPTLVLQAQERHSPVEVGPEEDYKVNSRLEHLFCEEKLSLNKKVSGSPYCGLSVFKKVF